MHQIGEMTTTIPLIDTKTVGRVKDFSGEEGDWELWRFRFEGWCSLLDATGGLSQLLQQAHEHPDAIDTETLGESAVNWGHLLYGLFSQVLQGKAASICMRVQRGNGLEVWRQVVKEYEPNLAGRHTAVLMSLLNPPWVEGRYRADLSLFVVDLLEWERKIARYEQETKEPFADRMKIATVFKHGPLELKRVLQAHSHTIGASYAAMRAHIEAFINSGREFTSAGISAKDPGPQPMEVGALSKGVGKPKGKGKGLDKSNGKGKVAYSAGGKAMGKDKDNSYKGKGGKQTQTGKGGQFQGHCSHCGKWGHKRMDCWKKQVTGAVAGGTREPEAQPEPGGGTAAAIIAPRVVKSYIFAVCAGISADGLGVF